MLSKTDFKMLFESGKGNVYLQYYFLFLQRDLYRHDEQTFFQKRQVVINERSSENGDYLSENRPLNLNNTFQN